MLNGFLDKYIFTGGLKYVHYNFFLMGIPFAMVPVGLLVSLAEKGDRHFDKEIYYSFKHSMTEILNKEFGVNFKVEGEKGVLLVEDLFSGFGWGAVKQVDLDKEKKRAIIVVNNSPVALKFSEPPGAPVDHFLRGIFAGIMTDYFETNVECVETKCMAINHSVCEFVIKPKSEFDFSKEVVQNQLDTEK